MNDSFEYFKKYDDMTDMLKTFITLKKVDQTNRLLKE